MEGSASMDFLPLLKVLVKTKPSRISESKKGVYPLPLFKCGIMYLECSLLKLSNMKNTMFCWSIV